MIAEEYELRDTRDWKLSKKRRSLAANVEWNTYFTECLYRPFDTRAYFHHEDVVELPRHEVMYHMLRGRNIGLITNRQINQQFQHVLCTDKIITDCTVSLETRERSYLFPLYLYPQPDKNTLFDIDEHSSSAGRRWPNLSQEFIEAIKRALRMRFVPDGKGDLRETFGPEGVFDYMYAVFHSPTYRTRYADFLKIDFPRLPLTSNADLFRELCKLGGKLVSLHLIEKSGSITTKYPVSGNNIVEKVEYTQPADNAEQGRVWINKTQYFDSVSPEVWNFHVGGYQVCHKWLKDRKGRTLSFDDIRHYQKVVAALAETIQLMSQIDEVIEEYGGWPIE